MTNPLYLNTLVQSTVNITAGTTTSPRFDCSQLLNHGTAQLRRITFPSNWTPCDVHFLVDSTDVNLTPFDGSTKSLLVIPGCAANDSVPLLPIWFDSITQFKIVCSTAQLTTNKIITLYLQPLYAANA